MIYQGHKGLLGVDTSTDPSTGRIITAFDAVNRSFRGGVNRTRPPFIEADLEFADDACEYAFYNGNVSGVFGYKQINNQTQPHLIVAVGNSLLAGRVYATKISFKCIYDEIDPQWQHSFFVQAEEILVWQNGNQDPQVWDGLSSSTQSASEAVASVGKSSPMPVGNIMAYAHGRIFVATEENIVYASDHIYSQGFGKNKTVVNFEETEYPEGGDGFGSYSQIGRITGMSVIPRHPEANGHGEVIVFGENGAWSIDPTPPRVGESGWLNLAIQQVVLLGRGCAGPHSIIHVNNDIFYRSLDRGISSFKNSITDRREAWADKNLSREVSRYVNFDSLDLLQFSSSILADNRLIMSCAVRGEQSEEYGNHRFGLGMVVLDLDRGSTINPTDEGFSWDGLWTGPRPTGMATVSIDNYPKHYVASYDSDGKNRIYLLTHLSENDKSNGVRSKIKSFYSFGDLFEIQNDGQEVACSTFSGAWIYFSDVTSKAYISSSHRPDRYKIWNTIMDSASVGWEPQDDLLHLNEQFAGSQSYSGAINTASPARQKFRKAGPEAVTSGFSHQVMVSMEGVVTINRVIAEADPSVAYNRTHDGNMHSNEFFEEFIIPDSGNEVDEGLYFKYTF